MRARNSSASCQFNQQRRPPATSHRRGGGLRDLSQRVPSRSCCWFVRLSLLFVVACALLPTVAAQQPAREHFVPADQLDVVLGRERSGVVLPREKFDALIAEARQQQKRLDAIPRAYVIRAAAVRIRQQDHHAIVEMDLDTEQFVPFIVPISLKLGHLQLEAASLDDGTAAPIGIAEDDPETVTLFHDRPGRFQLKLVLSTPLGTVGTDRLAAIRLPADVPSTVTVECPAERYLEVNDLRLTRPANPDQPATYTLPAGSQSELRLKWTVQEQTARMQTLIFAQTEALVTVGSGDLRWDVQTRISVFGNAINQLTAIVPPGIEVTGVESIGLESWKLEDDTERKGATRVVLDFRQQFRDERVVRLTGVRTDSADEPFRVPTLILPEVTAHTGRVRIRHDRQLRLRPQAGEGVRHLGTETAPGSQPGTEVFDFWLQDFELLVAVRPREQELFAEVNSSLSIVDTTATFRADLTIETLNAPLFELTLNVPDGWQPDVVTTDKEARLDWRNGSTPSTIVVTPPRPVAAGGLFPVHLQFRRTLEDPETLQVVDLPVVTAQDALTVGGTYEISAASDLIVTPLEVFGLSPLGHEDGILLYETQGTTWSGKLSVFRRPVRLSSRSVIRTSMDTRQKVTDIVVTVDVLRGTTRTLQIALSEDLGEDVRFQVVSVGPVPGLSQSHVPAFLLITQQEALPPENGLRTFQLTFDKRFAGAVTLQARILQDRNEDTQLTAAQVHVIKAVRQHGLVVFEAWPEQELTPIVPEGGLHGLRPADAGLVPPPADPGRRVALVFRFVRPDYSLTVSEARFETEPVPAAVCEEVNNVTVLSETGTTQRSCRVTLRCTGVQTLRFRLPEPEHAFLWSTVLDDRPVEVRRDGEDYLVSLPVGSQQQLHTLQILFQSRAPQSSLVAEQTQRSVTFAIDVDGREPSPIDVLKQNWRVRFPRSVMLVDYDGGFDALSRLDEPGLLQQIASTAKFPSVTELQKKLIPMGLFLLAVFVITALVSRRRWKTLATLVVLFGAGCFLLFGVSSVQYARVASTSARDDAMDMGYVDSELSDMDGAVTFDAKSEFAEDEAMAAAADEPVAATNSATRAPDSSRRSRRSAVQRGREANADKSEMAQSGGEEADSAPEAPADLSVGGFAGGGGGLGGGFGGGMFGADGGVSVSADDNGRNAQQVQPPAAPPAGGRQGLDGVMLGDSDRDVEYEAVTGVIAGGRPLTGGARLSVRADIARPSDYRSRRFRSIGGSADAGVLRITLLKQASVTGLRLVVAGLVFLFCLRHGDSTIRRKLSWLLIFVTTALGLVPVLSPVWQWLPDGLLFGATGGALFWMLRACVGFCGHLCGFWGARRQNRHPQAAGSVTAAVALLLGLTIVGGAAAAPQDGSADRSELEIVRPYSPDGPPVLADRVFVPRAEFEKLYRLAHPELVRDSSKTRRKAMVVGAFYQTTTLENIREDQWTQNLKARFVIRSFREQSVILPLGNVAVRTAVLDGQKAVLTAVGQNGGAMAPEDATQQAEVQQKTQQREKQSPVNDQSAGAWSVRVPGDGVHILDLEFSVPATVEGPIGHFTVPTRRVPTGTLVYSSDRPDLEVRVNGRSRVARKQDGNWVIPIASTQSVRIDWTPGTSRAAADMIYHANVVSAVRVDNAGLTLHSQVTLNCRQGQLNEIELQLPADYAIQQVQGKEVGGWESNAEDGGTLRVMFREPVTGDTTILLTLFRRAVFTSDAVTSELPLIAVRGASRDSGWLTVIAGREFEVRSDSLSGVTQVNPAESQLPPGVDKNARRVLAWRYTRHPAAVAVRIFRTRDRMTATVLNGVMVEPQRQLWTTLVTARIEGAPRRLIEIIVPQDAVLLDVSGNQLSDWYETSDEQSDQAKVLTVQLQQAVTGSVSVVVQSQRPSDLSQPQIQLQVPILRHADQVNTQLSIWLDPSWALKNATAEGWRRVGAGFSVHQQVRNLMPREPDISFTSTQTVPAAILIEPGRKPVTLTPTSVLVSTVTDTSVEVTLALNWRVSNACREFAFTLPAALKDVLDFQVPGLRELKTTEVQDGRFTVVISLQKSVRERLFVMGTGTLPLPGDALLQPLTPVFTLPAETSATLGPQSHFWVVVNQSSGLLTPADPDADGKDAALDDIRLPEDLIRRAVAIRRLQKGAPVSPWKIEFPAPQKISPAVVALAAHTTVIARDGTWRSRHVLQVRNESRQFLPVEVPRDTRILYCVVDGRPTRVVNDARKGRNLRLIPIPQSGELAAPFEVEFALSGTLGVSRPGFSGKKVHIPLPQFPEFREDAEYGITVSRNTWDVYIPRDWSLSLDEDPRNTNVISASEEDFEDVRVLSVVENTRSLLNKSGSMSQWWGMPTEEIEEQVRVLEELRGNTVETEQQRNETLMELRQAQQSLTDQQTQQFFLNDGDNRYLQRLDLETNQFNSKNNTDLLNSNSADMLFDAPASGKDFNFVVPEQEFEQKKLKESGERESSKPDGKATFGKQQAATPQNRPESRSQLLSRRGENLRRQTQQLEEKRGARRSGGTVPQAMDFSDEMQREMAPAFGRNDAAQIQSFGGQLFEQSGQTLNGNGLLQQGQAAAPGAPAQQPALTSTGLLSLQFSIPQEGVVHKFVRTGGNAQLTVTVRDGKSIDRGLGILWAVTCAFVAIVILRAASLSSLLTRLSAVAAIASAAAWLFVPRSSPVVVLSVFAVAVVGFAVMMVLRQRPKQLPH